MKIQNCMTTDVRTVNPAMTVQDAARMMAETDTGALPVADEDRLVGMITDRDIVIRAIGEGLGPNTPVSDVMSNEVKYCYDDDEVESVAQNMADIQVRRLPVVSRDKRLVGIITLSDLAISADFDVVGQALGGISRPGGKHCHTGAHAA